MGGAARTGLGTATLGPEQKLPSHQPARSGHDAGLAETEPAQEDHRCGFADAKKCGVKRKGDEMKRITASIRLRPGRCRDAGNAGAGANFGARQSVYPASCGHIAVRMIDFSWA
jgi:hypothetical protein